MPSTDQPSGRSHTLSRYTVLTAIATPANLLLLAITLSQSDLAPAIANLLVGSVMTIPSYVVSVQWVWRGAPVAPRRAAHFWLASGVNIALASAVMWGVTASQTMPRPVVTVVPLLVYAITWVLRYLWLDRRLFAVRGTVDERLELAPGSQVPGRRQDVALDIV